MSRLTEQLHEIIVSVDVPDTDSIKEAEANILEAVGASQDDDGTHTEWTINHDREESTFGIQATISGFDNWPEEKQTDGRIITIFRNLENRFGTVAFSVVKIYTNLEFCNTGEIVN
jgi:hypothetical protein